MTLIELIPALDARLPHVAELFGRDAPLQVDLGCGDGSFLRSLAGEHRDINFLGVERLLRRVRSSDRKAAELSNVRIIRAETSFLVQHLFPAGSVDAFYLLFPDPWPKRRHHRRRLFTGEFLNRIRRALTTGGSLFIATDHQDYFAVIWRLALSATSEWQVSTEAWSLPNTTFERKFIAAGLPIHRLRLRKISPVK